MSKHHPFTITDDLDRFFAKQRERFGRALTVRERRIQQAREAAHSESVMTDALVVTRRGVTFGGAPSRAQD